MKTIIVACGSGIATSTVITSKLTELMENNGIEHRIIQCSVNEIDTFVGQADLIVTSTLIQKEYPVPIVKALAYITTVGEEELSQKILNYLNS